MSHINTHWKWLQVFFYCQSCLHRLAMLAVEGCKPYSFVDLARDLCYARSLVFVPIFLSGFRRSEANCA